MRSIGVFDPVDRHSVVYGIESFCDHNCIHCKIVVYITTPKIPSFFFLAFFSDPYSLISFLYHFSLCAFFLIHSELAYTVKQAT